MYSLQALLTRHLTIGFTASLKQQFQARVLYSQTAEVGAQIDCHIFSIRLLLYSYKNFHFQDRADKKLDPSIQVDINYKPMSQFFTN